MTYPNPFWLALTTEHACHALGGSLARRYRSDILPFAAVAEPTAAALDELGSLLAPGESIWLSGPPLPRHDGLECIDQIQGLQMHWRPAAEPPQPRPDPPHYTRVRLIEDQAAEMVALTDVAFPGFFRPRTPVLGTYFGVRDREGTLVAMAGERLAVPGAREISAVCTHPDHRGNGLAALLLTTLLRDQRRRGLNSFLHVAAANARAVGLYRHLRFTGDSQTTLTRVRRPPPAEHL